MKRTGQTKFFAATSLAVVATCMTGFSDARAETIGVNAFDSSDGLIEFENDPDLQALNGGTISIQNNYSSASTTTDPGSTYFNNVNAATQPSGDAVFAGTPTNSDGDVDINFDASMGINAVGLYLASDYGAVAPTFGFEAFEGPDGATPLQGPFTTTISNKKDGVFAGISANSTITRLNLTSTQDDSLVFDDLRFSSIPQPASLALAGLGALMLCLNRSSRHRRGKPKLNP